jgi:hypothetical protein
MRTHTRKVKRTCIGPRHQSVAACFRTRKSARILVKRGRRPDAHTAPLQRMRRKFSAPGCTNMPVMSIVHAFMLTACLEACFWTRKRPRPRKIGKCGAKYTALPHTARRKLLLSPLRSGPEFGIFSFACAKSSHKLEIRYGCASPRVQQGHGHDHVAHAELEWRRGASFCG